MSCIFCDLVSGNAPCYKIWEDEKHLAFLSIYPNTMGFSVIIPKKHYSSYAFDLPDDVLSNLVVASKKVSRLLDESLEGVGRTGLIFEGYGVDHVHAKLVPMHGTGENSDFKPISSNVPKFFDTYEGYISSHDYSQMDKDELLKVQSKILSHHKVSNN